MGRRSERLSRQGMLSSDLTGEGDVIQVVSRAFDVLRCFEGHEARRGPIRLHPSSSEHPVSGWREHADKVAQRIVQLNGEPDFQPEGLATRSHSQYVEGDDLVSMIKEDLVAERIAIESYGEIVRFIGDKDPTTRRMMEGILAMEEEHAG